MSNSVLISKYHYFTCIFACLTLYHRSFDAGQVVFDRFRSLFKGNSTPFIRSDISARVVASANNWTAGFTSASGNTVLPKLNVIIGSGVRFHLTLSDGHFSQHRLS